MFVFIAAQLDPIAVEYSTTRLSFSLHRADLSAIAEELLSPLKDLAPEHVLRKDWAEARSLRRRTAPRANKQSSFLAPLGHRSNGALFGADKETLVQLG